MSSPYQIYNEVIAEEAPFIGRLAAAIYYGAADTLHLIGKKSLSAATIETLTGLYFKVEDMMMTKDFDAAKTAEYSLAQQPVAEVYNKLFKPDSKAWQGLLNNLKVDMQDIVKSGRLDFNALMVLINARRFCKRLPKQYSDYIKEKLSERSLYKFEWNSGENPSLKSRLQKLMIECHGLSIFKYDPAKSYTKKDLDALLPEMMVATDIEEHHLFADIVCSFKGLVTDSEWLQKYQFYLNGLGKRLAEDEDILLYGGMQIKLGDLYEDLVMTKDFPPEKGSFKLPETEEELMAMLDALSKEGKEALSMSNEQYAAKEEWELNVRKQPGQYIPGLEMPPVFESLKKIRKALNHISDQGHATFHKMIRTAAERQFYGVDNIIIIDWLHTEKMHAKDFPIGKGAKTISFGMSNEILRCDTDRTFFSSVNYILHRPEYKEKIEAFLKEVESKLRMVRMSPDYKLKDLDRIPWDAAHVFHTVMNSNLSLWEDELTDDDILTAEEIKDYHNAVGNMDTCYWKYGDSRLGDGLRECNRQIAALNHRLTSGHQQLKRAGLTEIAHMASSFRDSIHDLLASV